uniref:Calcyclin-binding protein n=1 Tax=Timema monikensis TaxID=170555 RepID=A0A7R9HR28_9NEOP|nr:unnamed protein product [Timema monikensis]
MKADRVPVLQLDVEELNKFLVAAQRQRVKEYLISQIKSLQTEIASLKQASQHNAFCNIKLSASNKPSCYEVKLNNYAWDQSDKFVKIYVTLKNVHTLDPGNVLCDYTNRSVVLHVNGLDNKNYTLPITNLLEEINKDQSYWKVKTDNVTVFLAKKNIGSKWTHMTCSEKKALDSKLPKMDGAGEDPSGGLMDMMKHMYETGDDEMKRTIAKAWTEKYIFTLSLQLNELSQSESNLQSRDQHVSRLTSCKTCRQRASSEANPAAQPTQQSVKSSRESNHKSAPCAVDFRICVDLGTSPNYDRGASKVPGLAVGEVEASKTKSGTRKIFRKNNEAEGYEKKTTIQEAWAKVSLKQHKELTTQQLADNYQSLTLKMAAEDFQHVPKVVILTSCLFRLLKGWLDPQQIHRQLCSLGSIEEVYKDVAGRCIPHVLQQGLMQGYEPLVFEVGSWSHEVWSKLEYCGDWTAILKQLLAMN